MIYMCYGCSQPRELWFNHVRMYMYIHVHVHVRWVSLCPLVFYLVSYQFVTSVHVHVCSWLCVYCLSSGLLFFSSYFDKLIHMYFHRMFGTVKNVLCSLSCPIIVPVAHCNVV